MIKELGYEIQGFLCYGSTDNDVGKLMLVHSLYKALRKYNFNIINLYKSIAF